MIIEDINLKSNDNGTTCGCTVVLPLPPGETAAAMEHEIHARFMRHLRLIPNSRIEIKILSAIQFAADMMDIGDALAAKMLVDMGLKAPRRAFPAAYLEHVDRSLMRSGWEAGGPGRAALALRQYWDAIGENRFIGIWQDYPRPSVPETVSR